MTYCTTIAAPTWTAMTGTRKTRWVRYQIAINHAEWTYTWVGSSRFWRRDYSEGSTALKVQLGRLTSW